MSDDPVVLIVEDDADLAALYGEWLGDDYAVRQAETGEAALWHHDDAVDIVILDRKLPDGRGEELLPRLRETDGDCQIAIVSGVDPALDLLELDIDEYIRKPVEREEFRRVVERLEARTEIEEALASYLAGLSKKRALETTHPGAELESDPRYRQLTEELETQRRRVDGLLSRLETDELTAARKEERPDEPDRQTSPIGEKPPLYRRRPAEFYGLWLLAALAYGLGDVVSTAYAVFIVPGVVEANPVVDVLLANVGLPGFLFLKLVVFLALLSISVHGARTGDRFSYYWPPVLMTLLGTALTAWNLILIVSFG